MGWMNNRTWAVIWSCCAACTSASRPATNLPQPVETVSAEGDRFRQLESAATAIDGQRAALLPAEPDQDIYLKLEASLPVPAHDRARGGYLLRPPDKWTVGMTETGEEVRVVFLEPEGGEMTVSCPETAALSGEVELVWLVRYARRNLLLTAAGPAWAVHVVPVAAQLAPPSGAPLFWVSSEASPVSAPVP